jgi:hypothetical protein
MRPPPAFSHGRRQAKIAGLMLKLMPHGQAVTECPLSTSDGVKAIEVAWISPTREENASEGLLRNGLSSFLLVLVLVLEKARHRT